MSHHQALRRWTPGGLWAVLEFYAFICWALCALVAVLRPSILSGPPLRLALGVRTDTLGAISFAVSVAASSRRRVRAERPFWIPSSFVQRSDSHGARSVLIRWTSLVRDFSLWVFVYIAANFLSHPRTMSMSLTHLASWPSERVTGATAFVLAFAASTVLAVVHPRLDSE